MSNMCVLSTKCDVIEMITENKTEREIPKTRLSIYIYIYIYREREREREREICFGVT
jgi:hypothetical protein